jgi:pSer/pThr/pTyr-binding forkhead associated (FHA) protein
VMRASDRDRERAVALLRARRTLPAAHVSLPAEGTIVVGRSRGCDVVMTEPTVSRRHLELRAVDGAWLAVDLGSSNGTWLLGRRVGRARVTPGDELVLGHGAAVVLDPARR